MKALLIYPRVPDTYWGFKHALRFVSKRAAQPPLGLLTVAALLPAEWEKRLIDLNVQPLRDRDLDWADTALVSAMSIQRDSAIRVLERCRRAGVRTVAGGPLFTTEPEAFPHVDHLVLGEAEITLPRFLGDLERGQAVRRYDAEGFSDLSSLPPPAWDLLNHRRYATLNLQYSRGCPYDCEFCDITVLCGRKVRTKSTEQVLAELDALHDAGWRGSIFLVDDNFVAGRGKLKHEILPAMIRWMESHGRPFNFGTEGSIEMADDEELMRLMVRAGFTYVFVGIETPHEESLSECGKRQNLGRDILGSVRRIQEAGLEVSAGFILGFDSDPPNVFERLSQFIQSAGIVNAMVGLLNAPRRTRLYRRLAREGRILEEASGNNTDLQVNFVPRMAYEQLVEGYGRVLRGIYSPAPYYRRVRRFLRRFRAPSRPNGPRKLSEIGALAKSMILIGVLSRERLHYWHLFFWTALRRPRLFPMAITFAIYGFHFRRYFQPYM